VSENEHIDLWRAIWGSLMKNPMNNQLGSLPYDLRCYGAWRRASLEGKEKERLCVSS
jgi:hypothetical protein